MIVTAKKHVSTLWVLFTILPWTAYMLNGGMINTAFVFSLRKFIENPVGLTFVLSLPNVVAIVVAPIASFMSDRVWTRIGRRKPFVVASFVGMIAAMGLMPLMPSVWGLLAAYLAYQAGYAATVPIEALKQEIIPPSQRGFATGAMTWCTNLGSVLFYFVLLGRFDDVTYMAGLPINGEEVIYWSGALLFALVLIIIVLGIRETDPKSELRGQRLSWRNIVGGILDRELWPVYLLVLTYAFLNFYSALGPLSNLLYTEQWGYTKQEMGVNVAIGGIANIFIIGALTFFADRLNRMRAFQTTICLLLLANLAYYCYVNFVLPDKHPTLVEIILFGELVSVLSTLTSLLYYPLAYDYVRRNKMGSYGAGVNIVMKAGVLITLNGVGLFVWAYAVLFQPPAGEMTRVVLRQQTTGPELLAALKNGAAPSEPSSGGSLPADALSARVWQATGVTAPTGRSWEIRRRDKASEQLAAEKTRLEASRALLAAAEKKLRDRAAAIRQRGETPQAAEAERAAAGKQAGVEELTRGVDAIDARLTAKAGEFCDRVVAALGDRLIADGDQVLAARLDHAAVVTLATSRRPSDEAAARMYRDLRRQYPGAIDLHAVAQDGRFALRGSLMVAGGMNEESAIGALQQAMERTAQTREPSLLVPGAAALERSIRPAVLLELETVEEPVETHVSPVTRVVNSLLAGFGHAVIDHRLIAIGRSLRSRAGGDQVRVERGATVRSISVATVLPENALATTPPADAVAARLQALLGTTAENGALAQARALYDQVETAAAIQRITIARPVLAAAYAPMQYDYMSGYLWMFVMASLGIVLTAIFARMEKKGFIRKYGVEEAAAAT